MPELFINCTERKQIMISYPSSPISHPNHVKTPAILVILCSIVLFAFILTPVSGDDTASAASQTGDSGATGSAGTAVASGSSVSGGGTALSAGSSTGSNPGSGAAGNADSASDSSTGSSSSGEGGIESSLSTGSSSVTSSGNEAVEITGSNTDLSSESTEPGEHLTDDEPATPATEEEGSPGFDLLSQEETTSLDQDEKDAGEESGEVEENPDEGEDVLGDDGESEEFSGEDDGLLGSGGGSATLFCGDLEVLADTTMITEQIPEVTGETVNEQLSSLCGEETGSGYWGDPVIDFASYNPNTAVVDTVNAGSNLNLKYDDAYGFGWVDAGTKNDRNDDYYQIGFDPVISTDPNAQTIGWFSKGWGDLFSLQSSISTSASYAIRIYATDLCIEGNGNTIDSTDTGISIGHWTSTPDQTGSGITIQNTDFAGTDGIRGDVRDGSDGGSLTVSDCTFDNSFYAIQVEAAGADAANDGDPGGNGGSVSVQNSVITSGILDIDVSGGETTEYGNSGSNGSDGPGGNGEAGGNGGSGGTITLDTIESSGNIQLRANGMDGSVGGNGGNGDEGSSSPSGFDGGDGAAGGNGGNGGTITVKNTITTGLLDIEGRGGNGGEGGWGGDGGDGSFGGTAGSGGDGANGGTGGQGGSITLESVEVTTNTLYLDIDGGTGGSGGNSGYAGDMHSGASPGSVGNSGSGGTGGAAGTLSGTTVTADQVSISADGGSGGIGGLGRVGSSRLDGAVDWGGAGGNGGNGGYGNIGGTVTLSSLTADQVTVGSSGGRGGNGGDAGDGGSGGTYRGGDGGDGGTGGNGADGRTTTITSSTLTSSTILTANGKDGGDAGDGGTGGDGNDDGSDGSAGSSGAGGNGGSVEFSSNTLGDAYSLTIFATGGNPAGYGGGYTAGNPVSVTDNTIQFENTEDWLKINLHGPGGTGTPTIRNNGPHRNDPANNGGTPQQHPGEGDPGDGDGLSQESGMAMSLSVQSAGVLPNPGAGEVTISLTLEQNGQVNIPPGSSVILRPSGSQGTDSGDITTAWSDDGTTLTASFPYPIPDTPGDYSYSFQPYMSQTTPAGDTILVPVGDPVTVVIHVAADGSVTVT